MEPLDSSAQTGKICYRLGAYPVTKSTQLPMLETIQAILLDFQEFPLATGVPRRLEVEALPGKATVCIGVRRGGKSTYLFQLMADLLARGVARQNILYLNFFDDRLHDLRHVGLAVVAEAYYSLYPQKKGNETVYCFFDEIQEVPGWEPFVDRLMRTENCQIYLSGSSAQMLSKEIATQMRGRALAWEIFPFSFREFLDAKGLASEGPLSTKGRLLVQNAFEDFWQKGGFPEVYDLERRLRIKVHQEYLNAILFRDLVERHDVAHPKAVTDLASWLLDNCGGQYSINSLTGYLKSLGHGVPKSAVAEYLEWFEDAYFLFTVRIFDASLARSNSNPKKVYCIDHSLVRSTSSGIMVNSGHQLENLVFVALRRRHPDVYYFKTRGGREVDFIVPARGQERRLVQVCESMVDPQTRRRELQALSEAMKELDLKMGFVVTRSEEERIDDEDGREIHVLPAWRFLLEFE